jgi:hypothetical protein
LELILSWKVPEESASPPFGIASTKLCFFTD